MSESLISCPECGHRFGLSDALTAQLEAEVASRLRADHEARLKRAVEEARASAERRLMLELTDLRDQLGEKDQKAKAIEAEQLELKRKTRELEEQNRTLAERTRAEVEAELRKEEQMRVQAAVAAAQHKVREDTASELKLLSEQLAEQQRKLREAQDAELALRREKSNLEARQRELDLEVARKIDEEKQRLEASIRKLASEEQALKLKERDKQIEDLKKLLEEAKRKSEQGSQELQGEVLELDIQAALERQFPQDVIKPVPKGMRGADLLQEVRDRGTQRCGTIIWETKNTRNWSPAWIDKLKEDQRAAGANLAVLVSVALPQEIGEFGRIEGVWVASLRVWRTLALALREQLIQVAFAHAASEGKQEKMELLYQYLCGDQFSQRVHAIVEAFTELREQIERERLAMEKNWRQREKQIERVMLNTVRMYAEMRGIVGKSLPQIASLELDCTPALEDNPHV
jgi:hypothetical protein